MTKPRDPPSFNSLEEACKWLEDSIDDSCFDNWRSARKDNEVEMAEYREALKSGCCGSFDIDVIVGGELMIIGCNYGH